LSLLPTIVATSRASSSSSTAGWPKSDQLDRWRFDANLHNGLFPGQPISTFRPDGRHRLPRHCGDRKSTRLNSSHVAISYAVFCSLHLLYLHSFPTRRSSDLLSLLPTIVATSRASSSSSTAGWPKSDQLDRWRFDANLHNGLFPGQPISTFRPDGRHRLPRHC